MRAALWTFILLGFMAPLPQTPPRTAAEIGRLGPQVGSRIPDFSLRDQNGRTRTLESILGRNGAMLVFFRSADW
jgi:hypothetical protein